MWKRAAGRKGAHLPSAPSCGIFGEQEQHTCSLNPLQAKNAVNCGGEETQTLPMLSSPVGLVAAALPACPTVHRNAQGSTPGATMLLRNSFHHPLVL